MATKAKIETNPKEQLLVYPKTLVLSYGKLIGSERDPKSISSQIEQGNTFSIAFDMSKAPKVWGGNGELSICSTKESNFVPSKEKMVLFNEGIGFGFMWTPKSEKDVVKVTIFGVEVQIIRVFVVGTHNGDKGLLSWYTGVMLGSSQTKSLIITDPRHSEHVMSHLINTTLVKCKSKAKNIAKSADDEKSKAVQSVSGGDSDLPKPIKPGSPTWLAWQAVIKYNDTVHKAIIEALEKATQHKIDHFTLQLTSLAVGNVYYLTVDAFPDYNWPPHGGIGPILPHYQVELTVWQYLIRTVPHEVVVSIKVTEKFP